MKLKKNVYGEMDESCAKMKRLEAYLKKFSASG